MSPRLVFATLLLLASLPTAAHAEPPNAEQASAQSSVRKEFVIGGVSLFAASYGASAWVGTWGCGGASASSVCPQHRKDLFIPVAGPIIYAANLAGMRLPESTDLPADVFLGPRLTRWIGVSMFVADSAVQLGGLALAVYGLAGNKKAPSATQAGVSVHPVLSPTSLGLRGEF